MDFRLWRGFCGYPWSTAATWSTAARGWRGVEYWDHLDHPVNRGFMFLSYPITEGLPQVWEESERWSKWCPIDLPWYTCYHDMRFDFMLLFYAVIPDIIQCVSAFYRAVLTQLGTSGKWAYLLVMVTILKYNMRTSSVKISQSSLVYRYALARLFTMIFYRFCYSIGGKSLISSDHKDPL